MQEDQAVLVSIILPVYNAEAFLKEAIQSILKQSYSNWELILIDDGSKDRSLDIMQSYKDNRIKVYSLHSNQGIISALNKGIALAKGKYIARMDADDMAFPERLKKQVVFLEKHPHIGLLGTQVQIINQGGKRNFRERLHPHTHELIQLRSLFFCSFYHSTVMVRSHLLKASPYEATVKAEDYFLWVKLLQQTQGANLAEALLQFRRHASNISKTQQQEYLNGILPIYERAFEGIGWELSSEELQLLQLLNGYGSAPLPIAALENLDHFLNRLQSYLLKKGKFRLEDIQSIWQEVWHYAMIKSGKWSFEFWRLWLFNKKSYTKHFLKSSLRIAYRATKAIGHH